MGLCTSCCNNSKSGSFRGGSGGGLHTRPNANGGAKSVFRKDSRPYSDPSVGGHDVNEGTNFHRHALSMREGGGGGGASTTNGETTSMTDTSHHFLHRKSDSFKGQFSTSLLSDRGSILASFSRSPNSAHQNGRTADHNGTFLNNGGGSSTLGSSSNHINGIQNFVNGFSNGVLCNGGEKVSTHPHGPGNGHKHNNHLFSPPNLVTAAVTTPTTVNNCGSSSAIIANQPRQNSVVHLNNGGSPSVSVMPSPVQQQPPPPPLTVTLSTIACYDGEHCCCCSGLYQNDKNKVLTTSSTLALEATTSAKSTTSSASSKSKSFVSSLIPLGRSNSNEFSHKNGSPNNNNKQSSHFVGAVCCCAGSTTAHLDAKALAIFSQYRDLSKPDTILVEGIEQMCKDLDLMPDEFRVLVFAWKCDLRRMCVISRREFLQGMRTLNADNVKTLASKLTETAYTLKTDEAAFKELYRFTFSFGLEPPSHNESDGEAATSAESYYGAEVLQRSLSVEMAIALWRLVFSQSTPRLALIDRWLDFLYYHEDEIRGISRDTWNMFLHLMKVIGDDLSLYDDNEAWPSLFDDFVEYESDRQSQIVSKQDSSNNKVEEEEADEELRTYEGYL